MRSSPCVRGPASIIPLAAGSAEFLYSPWRRPRHHPQHLPGLPDLLHTLLYGYSPESKQLPSLPPISHFPLLFARVRLACNSFEPRFDFLPYFARGRRPLILYYLPLTPSVLKEVLRGRKFWFLPTLSVPATPTLLRGYNYARKRPSFLNQCMLSALHGNPGANFAARGYLRKDY